MAISCIQYDSDGFPYLCLDKDKGQNGLTLPDIKIAARSIFSIDYAESFITPHNLVASPQGQFSGTYIKTGEKTFGILLGEELNPFLYRGENKKYSDFVPSAQRYNTSDANAEVKRCIDWIKKQEFLALFKKSPYYIRCRRFSVLDCMYEFDLEAVAQHYGFVTNYIDVTKDLFTALFFAYTYIDADGYHPITDFKSYCPMLYSANMQTFTDAVLDQIKIIGFQSVLRPFKQTAMALDVSAKGVKQFFTAWELPKDYAVSSAVYEHFFKGKDLFPDEIISYYAQLVLQEHLIDEKLLVTFCRSENRDESAMRKSLIEAGYTISNVTYDFSPAQTCAMHSEITGGIIPFLQNKIAYRAVCPMADAD